MKLLHRRQYLLGRYNPGFATATALELDPTKVQRPFADGEAQRKANQVGIVKFYPGAFRAVVGKRDGSFPGDGILFKRYDAKAGRTPPADSGLTTTPDSN